jgi:hypothetical protein
LLYGNEKSMELYFQSPIRIYGQHRRIYLTCGLKEKTEKLNDNKVGFVRFEVFAPVTMENAVLRDVMLCDSCKNRRFGGT